MKLSFVMMVKDESKNLKKCLESLNPIMEEIDSELIIVDTGSEDNTVEIARQYTDKIYCHTWNNDFSSMRNTSINYAKGEWIFVIDGDEVIENPQELIDFFKSNKSQKCHTGMITIKSYFEENNDLSYGTTLINRLFKNSKNFKYIGVIHEQPKFQLPVHQLNLTLIHYGYMSTDKELMEEKFKRNIKIIKSELEKDKDNIYYSHQLFQSYGMHKNYKQALKASINTYEILKKKKLNPIGCMYVHLDLISAYYWNGKFKEAEKYCKEALKISDEYIDIYYILGKSQKKLAKTKESIKSFEKYIDLHKNYHKYRGFKDTAIANNTLGFIEDVYLELSILYEKTKEYNKALDFVKKIEKERILNNIVYNIPNIFLKANRYDALKEYYENKIINKSGYLQEKFLYGLERSIVKLDKNEKYKIFCLFASMDNDYAILSRMRVKEYKNNCLKEDLLEQLKILKMNSLPKFYGDIIYYLIKNSCDLSEIFPNLREKDLQRYLNYLSSKEEISLLIYKYLKERVQANHLNQLRINKALCHYLLLQNELNQEEYHFLFNRYMKEGIFYLRQIYHPEIIEKQRINELKSDEEIFLLYIYHSKDMENKDKVKHIRYLRKALKVYPQMKEGIEQLLRESISKMQNKESEINRHEVVNKSMIQGLIHQNRLEKAMELIHKYEEKKGDDLDIYSFKGIIGMMENRLEDAEKNLEEGLKIDSNHFDLVYNRAYLCYLKEQWERAIYYYEKALLLTKEIEIQEEIKNTLIFLYNETKQTMGK